MNTNRLGMHMMLYTSTWSEPDARVVFERAKSFGYDFVELLMFDADTVDVALTRRLIQEYDLPVEATVCGAPDADLSSDDPEIVRRGEAAIARGIEVAGDIGATLVGGPNFSAVQRYHSPPSAAARERIVESYARLADRAASAGLRLGLEALNRYESNFVNTLAQAADIVRKVGSSSLFVHADLFHMNMEEPCLAAAVKDVGDVLGYVHVAESNRGALGTGNTDWPAFFTALAEIGYDGPITFESFSPAVLGEEMTALLALWRVPWTDPDIVARDALTFMRDHIDRAHHSKA
ncbi:sugar phosphate isomerase/epimerase family protein [Streptomyces sp. NPDC004065]|uniref:sugar phosphate isomerase/epimerase family protein n=1 Tax=Streptomyces sp. NPDC004065 TaxID=3364689 RepID=UPI00384CCBD4